MQVDAAAGTVVRGRPLGGGVRRNMLMTPLPTADPHVAGESRTAHIPLYKVLLHNDDVNTMDHVVRSLMKVFRFDRQACELIMIEAHREGAALCTIEPLEQAELHRDQLRTLSLTATIEPE